jgi:hypothetical protein
VVGSGLYLWLKRGNTAPAAVRQEGEEHGAPAPLRQPTAAAKAGT